MYNFYRKLFVGIRAVAEKLPYDMGESELLKYGQHRIPQPVKSKPIIKKIITENPNGVYFNCFIL